MPDSRRSRSLVALVLGAALLAGACGTISTSSPEPTPGDFQGIATELSKRGIVIEDIVSGDAGCEDRILIPTAIGFTASGLDRAEPGRIYLYIFRNRDAFERLRATVDQCARSYVTDPETFETVEQSPYVVAAQGPWPAGFEGAVRDALEVAAGTGD